MPPTFQALVFDLDGTLVDSTAMARKVMEKWALKNHIPLQSVLDVYHGARTEDTVALVAPHLNAQAEAAEIEHMEGTSLDEVSPIAGAGRFLASLAPEAWAIATSSTHPVALPKLAACHLPVPKILITAESVTHGKPHPEPYLKAALELKLAPQDCLVFEDADNGVNSALSAGCLVIIIGDACKIQHDHIIARIPDFRQLYLNEDGHLKVGDELIASLEKAHRLP